MRSVLRYTPDMDSTQIAAVNMRRYRTQAGLTQEELGERIGWSKASVSAAERTVDAPRKRAFALRDVDLVADALGVTPVQMITAPAPCATCGGTPPAGMTCQECGTPGAPFKSGG